MVATDHAASSGIDERKDDQSTVALVINGSVALDTQAKTSIKAALRSASVLVQSEKLLVVDKAVGGAANGSINGGAGSPRLALLLSSSVKGSLLEILERVCLEDDGPNSLRAVYGDCFTIVYEREDIDKLFKPSASEESAKSVDSPAGPAAPLITPEHERRVFSFDNDTVSAVEDDEHEEEEGDSLDELPSRVLTHPPPRSPLGCSTPASGSMLNSASSRRSSSVEPGQQSPPHAISPRSASVADTGRPGGAIFKARKAPTSTSSPSVTPRLSKTAALRMGISLPDTSAAARRKAKEQQVGGEDAENADPNEGAEGSVQGPGMGKRGVTPPKSLSKPTIAPRRTRSSLLRTDGSSADGTSPPRIKPPTSRRQSLNTSERSNAFIGLPGFAKRRVGSPGPSTSADTASPAENRASMLRRQSSERIMAPIPKPTQRRESMTTAERAAAFASTYGRRSSDFRSPARSPMATPPASIWSSGSQGSRPSLTAERSNGFFPPTPGRH